MGLEGRKQNQEWQEKQGQEAKESGWWEGKLQAEYRQLTELGAGHIPFTLCFLTVTQRFSGKKVSPSSLVLIFKLYP